MQALVRNNLGKQNRLINGHDLFCFTYLQKGISGCEVARTPPPPSITFFWGVGVGDVFLDPSMRIYATMQAIKITKPLEVWLWDRTET